MSEPHWQEVDRLWRTIKRDVLFDVESFAGLHPSTDEVNKRDERLFRNWRKLCELDIDVATLLWHGFDQLARSFGSTGPAERHQQGMNEMVGLADFARPRRPRVDG